MTGRTPTLDDAPAVAALLARVADAEGAGWTTVDEVRGWLTHPEIPIENFRVFELDGELAAYADVYPTPDGERGWIDVRIPPEREGSGVEDEAVAWAERRLRDCGRRVARAQVSSAAPLASLLAARGYRQIRHSFQMRIELDEPPPAPEWPPGISVRTVQPGEERDVHAAAMDAFTDHWEFTPEPFEGWLHGMSAGGADHGLWFLAVDGAGIAGVCLCSVNRRAAGRPTGWVDMLGVRTPHRRRGIGRSLLLHAFGAFRQRGLPVAGLGVDGENLSGAVRLYEEAGMHVAYRSDSWELELG